MIEIYFDGKLLDNQNYLGFDVSFQPFDKEFYLGSTGSINASLTIPKEALPDSLNKVLIKINDENWYSCVVDSIEETDNEEYKITLMDALTHTEVNYDFSEKVPISAKTLLEDICTDFNIPHDEFNFTNQDVITNSYDSSMTARDYIGMIAELAGGYATINKEGKLEIKTYKDSIGTNTIDADEVDTFKIKNTVTIERVVWQFVSDKKESSLDESLYTIYLDGNNLFLQTISDEQFADICNNIIGFSFSSIKITTTNKFFNDKQIIKFTDREENVYNLLPFFEASYNGGLIGSYDSNLENSKENETRVRNNSQNIKRIKQTVDQNANTLHIAVEDITTQKEITNPHFDQRISKNSTDIEVTATSIRQEVSDKETQLKNDIAEVQKDLDETEENLNERITENKSSIEILSQNITSTVKSIGGNNLLRNSVGFAKSIKSRPSKNLLDLTDTNWKKVACILLEDNKTIRANLQGNYYANLENSTQEIIDYLMARRGTKLTFSFKEAVPNMTMGIVIYGERSDGKTYQEVWPEGTGFNLCNIEISNQFTSIKRVELRFFRIYPFQTITDTTSTITELMLNEGEYLPYEDPLKDVYYNELDFWNTNDSSNVDSLQDTDTESTTVSGSKLSITGPVILQQEYVTQINTTYGVSLKLKHLVNGGTSNPIKIRILDGERELNVLNEEQQTREYKSFIQLSEFTYEATIANPKIIIEYEGDDLVEISDLIISSGENQTWSSYFDELYGKEHRLDKYGLRLTDIGTGDYSQQTSKGLTFVDDNEIVSEISRTQAKANAGRFDNEITLRKLQMIVLDDDNIIEYVE